MSPPRSRLRAYLLLARVSNLPTVWTNVVAGLAAAGAAFDFAWLLTAAASCFYCGGMFLNDAFDVPFDVDARPDRPIPAGDVSRIEAFAVGSLLLAAGESLLLFTPHALAATAWGALLGAAIVFYDYRHKGEPFGPAVMGLCRALVYCVAAAATAIVSRSVVAVAALMWAYVVALTWVAKRSGARAGLLVPWLLAGISVIDAAIIAAHGHTSMALLAVGAFALTRALQRLVPGT